MKIRWLLQACIVVAVGMGFVSCTKAEIEQAMNRPAEIILQSSPCTPAGIASTATPEFCVNVTELQLLRQDTQSDVSLTLVNRTGRRQFISLTGANLTDNSGAKWAWTRSSGLGDSGNPLPLEPNVETQGSVVFYHNGQAPADLTFSLRGEFAILRVDSRGQPINQYPYAAKRGFNLSGIRIQQQPPQSSAPAEQNPDTKLAQIAPRGVELSASRTEKPDVLGIRLGMSPDEARVLLKKQGFPLKPSDVSEATIEGLPNSRYIASMTTYSKALGSVSLHFSAPPTPSGVIRLDRSVQYDKGESGAPSEDNLLKALNDKFGGPLHRLSANGNIYLTWIWTQDGKPAPISIHERCRNMSPSPTAFDPKVQRMIDEGCGWLLNVTYAAEGGVVTSVLQIMVDVAGGATASKATVEAAREKNLDRANKQKPAL